MTLHHTGIQRASWPMGARIALLLSAVLWALILSLAAALAQAPTTSPANSDLPPQHVIDKAIDYIRSDPKVLAAVIRSAAAQMLAQTNPPPAAAASSTAPQAAAPPAPPTPAIAVVPAPQTITIPAEVRDAVISLCSLLITAGIGVALTWMRSHFAFMKEAGANAAITSSAQGLGALLEQELAKQGKSLSSVSISDPNVAAAAQRLIAAFPEWGPLIGLTPDIAERKVLAGAIQQSVAPIVPAPVVIAPPLAVVEAAATPQSPPPA